MWNKIAAIVSRPRSGAVVAGTLSALIAVEGACFVGCASSGSLSQGTKDGAVKVGVEACKELGAGEGEWVELACEAGGQIVKVLLPRREWAQIRARTASSGALAPAADAGPGR